MSPQVAAVQVGRRERNKQVKRERIVAAAAELFSTRGVDDVTTQEIADRADVGAGTLFLYVRSKGELLLLVQNSRYEEALTRGGMAAEATADVLEGVLAVVREVVACNRVQTDNGRTYLREMVFGDADDEHRAEALDIVHRTELVVEDILSRGSFPADRTASLARAVSAIMLLAMATAPTGAADSAIIADVRGQLQAVLGV